MNQISNLAQVDGAGSAWSHRRVAVASITGSWALYLSFIAVRLTLIGFPRELLLLERHLLTVLAGAALTWGLYLVLRSLDRKPVALRIVTAAALALPATVLLNMPLRFVIRSAYWPGLRRCNLSVCDIGCHGIAGGHPRHFGRICDAQTVNAMHAKPGTHHDQMVGAAGVDR